MAMKRIPRLAESHPVETARELVSSLNTNRASKDGRRLECLVRTFKDFVDIDIRLFGSALDDFTPLEEVPAMKGFVEMLNLTVGFDVCHPRIELRVKTAGDRVIFGSEPADDQSATLILLSILSRTGNLWRIDQCAVCPNWLIKRDRRTKCCSGRCRRKMWRETPKGKRRRAKIMRDYRAQLKKNQNPVDTRSLRGG
jgi:hypothetical protein